MKNVFLLMGLLISMQILAQDSTMNNLTQDMDKVNKEKMPVKIFNSEKVINANTTEVVGKGKMDFKVTHNFSDVAGHEGGVKNFFGLDNTTDVRIGFDIGLTNRLDISFSHSKGDEHRLRPDTLNNSSPSENLPGKLYEIALKYQLLQQLENDASHPFAVSFLVQSAISTQSAPKDINGVIIPNTPRSFENFGDRISEVFQIIIAKKMGKVSLQLNPTLVHHNYVPFYDDATTFALGAATRIPLSRSIAIIVDYFHPFLSDTKKENYYSLHAIKFHDPLSIGFEILTAGHVFHLNFTNTTAILENQFIPYNTNSWGKGQFRWGFNLSRKFVLWREKK
ncbi:MAG TPA: DUF5777 family beta-barrel protein [Chitinophagaceae bacterium]|nr:DUF5777 family beta-barrel protein [Chitinophagaceae bacterium]